MLAALRVTGLTAPAVFEGAIDGPSFLAYIEQILVPTLHPGDLVIADNLSAHKVLGGKEILAAAGAAIEYLPPYSPDLNSIELCFAPVMRFLPDLTLAAVALLGIAFIATAPDAWTTRTEPDAATR